MILFYVEKTSPRVRYIVRLLLKELLGLDLRFTNDKEEYIQATIPKINYSKEPLQSGLYLQAANLLFETDIFEQDIKIKQDDDTPLLFQTGSKSSLPFDPFAAAFYLVSRYEEYIPFIADEHHRFTAQESLLYRLKALDKPLVNIYAERLANLIFHAYPKIEFKRPQYRFVNTIDIDNASAYRGKGLFRTLGSYAKDLMQFKFREIAARTRVLTGFEKDPFDTFDYLLDLQEKHGFQSIFFALFSRLGQYDRSLTRHSALLQRYLKGIGDFCEVGLHPSYRSNLQLSILEEELLSLERVLKKDVTKSRQHFLRLSFPLTYRNLLEYEITDDYSMGYASECGFRAGICVPFRFYDLESEVETPLRIHPFPFMDGTFIYYLKKRPQEAQEIIAHYIEIYRQYGGEFIPVWHNRVFSEKEPEWKGWNEVYQWMIQAAL